MIYLRMTTDAQVVFIPRSLREVTGKLTFIARSTIDKKELIRSRVVDLETSELYYRLSLALGDDLPVGEYEYLLTDDAGTLSQGLLMIGEFASFHEYNKSIEYEQYEQE